MTKTIQIFKHGTQTDSVGTKITFDHATLEGIVSFANTGAFKVPGVIGHPRDSDPAVCWGQNYAYSRSTGIMTADVAETDPAFAEMLVKRMYDKISVSFFSPTSPANPNPGNYSLRHIGFLGAAAPAVAGLAPVSFAAGDLTHEFSDWNDSVLARLMRNVKNFLIADKGPEFAEQVLPESDVESLELATPKDAAPSLSAPTEALAEAPAAAPVAAVVEVAIVAPEPASTKPESSDYTERETALNAREAKLSAKEGELAVTEFTSFCESAEAAGQVLGIQREAAVAIFRSLRNSATVDFAEDGAVAPTKLFRDFIAALPTVVTFSEVSKPEGAPTAEHLNFAAPAGATVDPAGLANLARAEAYIRQHPGTSILDAIKTFNPL